jgi:imidazolonepropionase-like amidohydrolase
MRAITGVDEPTKTLRAVWLAEKMLGRGFTTVRDAAGAPKSLAIAFEEGLVPGPRLFVSGMGALVPPY